MKERIITFEFDDSKILKISSNKDIIELAIINYNNTGEETTLLLNLNAEDAEQIRLALKSVIRFVRDRESSNFVAIQRVATNNTLSGLL